MTIGEEKPNLTRVNARLFRAAYNCVSTEETRYYLNGVQIERHPVKGVFLVATDGRRMVVIHDESGSIEGDSRIVRLDKVALTACKAGKGEAKDRILVVSGANATVTSYDDLPVHAAYGVVIDGTFPDWRRIARPNLSSVGAAAYNPKHLADFGKVADELSEGKNTAISIAGGPPDPALIRFNNIDHAYGVLMPIRFAGNVLAFPMEVERYDP
ncbi:DNA polymerase III subunit beta family protein [Ochrobactrum sp. A-1]|uniref:DNA polymerase III subunit beta family protein n=1 Tax=Ochrobactrum sp. A-1 TaxID=2920940 RepID=UPI001F0A72F7|nr:hypothetical protein [Ochrobactrum sp. A-1]